MSIKTLVAILFSWLSASLLSINSDSVKSDDWIVFTAHIGSYSEAFRLNPTTGEYLQLSRGGADLMYRTVGAVACRKDISNQIIFGAASSLHITNGIIRREIISPASIGVEDVDWSPDGMQLIISSYFSKRGTGSNLHIFDLTTSSLTSLVQSQSVDMRPSWSPNGQEIAYVSFERDSAYIAYDRNYIYSLRLVKKDGTDVRSILHSVKYISQPQWSPDGQWLAFDMTGDETTDIYRIRPDGSQLTRLRQNAGLPAWSPDGSLISFTSIENDVWSIYVMSPDGSNVRKIEMPPAFSDRLFNACWMRVPVSSP